MPTGQCPVGHAHCAIPEALGDGEGDGDRGGDGEGDADPDGECDAEGDGLGAGAGAGGRSCPCPTAGADGFIRFTYREGLSNRTWERSAVSAATFGCRLV